MDKKKLFLLDGMALAYRAYFALIKYPRMTSTGLNTSAIFGFTNTIVNIIKTQNPTHMAVAFDTQEPTQRHREYPEYKAQRDKIPEDLLAALPHIRRITEAFEIPVITCPGFEADDIIGTLAKQAEEHDFTSYMVTPDKDFGQLVSEKTFLFRPARSGDDVEIMGVAEILQKWSISEVTQLIDVLGLWGDASDNIPGIPGIGEKTAKTLVARFGTIESLIENVNELKGKQKENVITYADQGLLSKRLVTINRNVPVQIDLDTFLLSEFNLDRLKPLLVEFEFNTLGKRLFGNSFSGRGGEVAAKNEVQPDLFADQTGGDLRDHATNDAVGGDTDSQTPKLRTIDDVVHQYRSVSTQQERAKLIESLNRQERFCFDTETTGLDPKTAELIGIAFSYQAHEGYFLVLPADRRSAKQILDEFAPHLNQPRYRKNWA